MAKKKRKLAARERAEKKRRRQEFMTIFMHGKMKRIRRSPQIDGVDVDEFIRQNADPACLHQIEMWECIFSYSLVCHFFDPTAAYHGASNAVNGLRAAAARPWR